MVDRVSASIRSKTMSRIRKKWSKIDRKTHGVLKSARVPHQMYPKLAGSPDILIYPDVLVFLDGCFWHCCPKCFRPPKSRLAYWRPKLVGNKRRDVKISRLLRKQGWKIFRIWEHEVRAEPKAILRRLEKTHRKTTRQQVRSFASTAAAPKSFRRPSRSPHSRTPRPRQPRRARI